MGKKAKGFNTPFEELEALRKQMLAEQAAAKRAPKPAPAPAAATPVAPLRDEEVFAEEMRGVVHLPADPRGRVVGGVAATPTAPRRRRVEDESEAYAELADLVEGSGHFDITATDEYIEGLAPGIDKRLLRKLRAGDYSVQAHLDLHGLVSDEARPAVEKFLLRARADGRRCVLIIHGRGLNSKEGIPVLKERLKVWLTRGRIAGGVLAFCTARPADGGAGAAYVLLRK